LGDKNVIAALSNTVLREFVLDIFFTLKGGGVKLNTRMKGGER